MAARIALKVDVDTLRGSLEGVPALVALFERLQVQATFLFSVGPDHTGRALRRIFRRGFLRKVLRTSVPSNYGWKTLCYGTLLRGPDIGRRAGNVLRGVRDAGFEIGVHCYDHVLWQDHVVERDYEWTRYQMQLAVVAFDRIFGKLPKVHGAAGWQVNEHTLALESAFGFDYASDTRGSHPFIPAGHVSPQCPQLPTTLPTFDELIGLNGCSAHNVAEVLLRLSETQATQGHVFTLHAELEGMRLCSAFERLLNGWKARGVMLGSLHQLHAQLPKELPLHHVMRGEVPGRAGQLACQGARA